VTQEEITRPRPKKKINILLQPRENRNNNQIIIKREEMDWRGKEEKKHLDSTSRNPSNADE
jgi:hypothetical protein